MNTFLKKEAPGGFAFGYEVKDSNANLELGAKEESNDGVSVKGTYHYISPDGTVREVNYIADENGFQPTG